METFNINSFPRLTDQQHQERSEKITALIYPVIEGYSIGEVEKAFALILGTIKEYQPVGIISPR